MKAEPFPFPFPFPKIFAPVRNPPARRRKRRAAPASPPPPPPPPPAAVLLTAVHADGATLMFVFDDDIVGIDGVGADQFEAIVNDVPLAGDSIIEFDGAHILVAFLQ